MRAWRDAADALEPPRLVVFSSITFLFYFLPVALLLHQVLPRFRNQVVLMASVTFYAAGELELMWTLAVCVLGTWISGLLLASPRRGLSNLGLGLGLLVNLGLLGAFKIAEFTGSTLGGASELRSSYLPLGVSFFTLQALSYVLEVRRGGLEPERSLFKLSTFITMFPQIIAGPIVRYEAVRSALTTRSVGWGELGLGARLFMVGLGQKVLLGDPLNASAAIILSVPPAQLSSSAAWLGAAFNTLGIYHDFAGYSTMAIGLGSMLGFRLPINFDHPLASRSISELWRRWHITLMTWIRDFLYVPLERRHREQGAPAGLHTYLHILAVFLVVGLWHGSGWNYLLFGLANGIIVMFERLVRERGWRLGPAWLGHVYTVLIFTAMLCVFSIESLEQLGAVLRAMLGVTGADAVPARAYLDPPLIVAGLAAAASSLPILPWLKARLPAPVAFANAGLAALGLLIAILVASTTHRTFVYFRF